MNKTRITCLAMAAVMAFAAFGSPELMAAKKKKVKLNKSKITLRAGQTFQLKLKNNKKKITWSSSKKTVVKVNKKGKVTALKEGTAKITAKIAKTKKKYNCKVTVRKNSIPSSLPPSAYVDISAVNEYTIMVKLRTAKALTKEDFSVRRKTFYYGQYNNELKIDSVTTTDNLTYKLTLAMDSEMNDGDCISVTVANYLGVTGIPKEIVYKAGNYNYQSAKVYEVYTNENVREGYEIPGTGYVRVVGVKGFPAGISYELSADGKYIGFCGSTSVAGTYNGTIIIEDELGNTYTEKIVWLVGSKDTIAATILPLYCVAGKDNTATQRVYVCGGSTNYKYEIIESGIDCTIGYNGIVSVGVNKAGNYQIKIKVTDKNNPSIATTIAYDIFCTESGNVVGIVKDALGNSIDQQKYSGGVKFVNKDKASLYMTEENVTADNNGTYSAILSNGTYDAYAYINDARCSLESCQVNSGITVFDFILPVYPVIFECGDTELLTGDWYDEYGKKYYMHEGKMYLKKGIYKFTREDTTGEKQYKAEVTVIVNDSAGNKATVVVNYRG